MTRRWRIVQVPAGEEKDTDLTDSELFGVSVVLTQYCDNEQPESVRYRGVYWDARTKIQPQVEASMVDAPDTTAITTVSRRIVYAIDVHVKPEYRDKVESDPYLFGGYFLDAFKIEHWPDYSRFEKLEKDGVYRLYGSALVSPQETSPPTRVRDGSMMTDPGIP